MIARFIPAVILVILAGAFPVRAQTQLQPSVTVTGSVIRLGDLFSNAGDQANDPVAAAPALGTRVTYSAAWLRAAARAHQLAWSPASEFDQAVIERASRVIPPDAIAQKLIATMPAAALGTDTELRFDALALRLLVPAEASDEVEVDGLTVDPRNGRFSAMVSAPPGAVDAQRLRVTGKLVVQSTVPVPNRSIAINDVITAGDIEELKVQRERVAGDTITDRNQLIGKAARHLLRAEQPLRAGDVQDPIVVHKGDLVTIELRTATMQLAAQGKALEDGALNVTIRVVNTQSNRTIDASVAGANLVRAGGSDRLAAR